MAGQVRQGRRYLPPIAATGVLHIGDWVRDDLPDLFWPILYLAENGTSGAIKFVRWQEAVQHDLAGLVEPRPLAAGLDGRLTSLDRLVGWVPAARARIKQRAFEFGLLPDSVATVMASYPDRPAAWLIDLDARLAGQEEINLLARAILQTLHDRHREAVIKCLSIWSEIQAGTFRSDTAIIDILKDYPNDSTTRAMADSRIRASWGARRAALLHTDPHHFDATIEWAKDFWNINSITTRCLRRQDSPEPESVDSMAAGATPENGTHLRQQAIDILTSYIEVLESSPAQLYDQERQEVHSGLVALASREVITALGAPDLWCMEHGAQVFRILVETRIYLQWMALQIRPSTAPTRSTGRARRSSTHASWKRSRHTFRTQSFKVAWRN